MPSARPQTTRERMVISAALLIRERGLTGTSFDDVITHSGAPRGSIYHHFPAGKQQLAEEAVRYADAHIRTMIARATADGDPQALLRAFSDAWQTTLQSSGFRAGCPVVAAAVEAQDDGSGIAGATADAFTAWQSAIERVLRDRGLSRARARRLATTTIAAFEGAVVLCRAHGEVRPLTDVTRDLEDLYELVLAGT